jgi:hypothetical protein
MKSQNKKGQEIAENLKQRNKVISYRKDHFFKEVLGIQELR